MTCFASQKELSMTTEKMQELLDFVKEMEEITNSSEWNVEVTLNIPGQSLKVYLDEYEIKSTIFLTLCAHQPENFEVIKHD